MLDLTTFERLTIEESASRYDWGSEAAEGTTIYHGFIDGFEVFADQLNENYNDGEQYVCTCEINDEHGGLAGQWFDTSLERAIYGAYIDMIGLFIARENGNSEDTVNSITRAAYVALFGNVPIYAMDYAKTCMLQEIAREWTRKNAKHAGFEWEEY